MLPDYSRYKSLQFYSHNPPKKKPTDIYFMNKYYIFSLGVILFKWSKLLVPASIADLSKSPV